MISHCNSIRNTNIFSTFVGHAMFKFEGGGGDIWHFDFNNKLLGLRKTSPQNSLKKKKKIKPSFFLQFNRINWSVLYRMEAYYKGKFWYNWTIVTPNTDSVLNISEFFPPKTYIFFFFLNWINTLTLLLSK